MNGTTVGNAGRINQYGLVAYIEGELGDFLLKIRKEIVPGCKLRSHVSILPPRPLAGSEAEAIRFIQNAGRHHSAFEVALGKIEVFPITNVIYIALGSGVADLTAMHSKLNTNALSYTEPYPYHPHITLAQELTEEHHPEAHALCLARWQEYCGPRKFPVETLTFVQNTTTCGWVDLAETRLEMAGSRL